MAIKFVKYKAPKTSLMKRVVAELAGKSLVGDWLNPAPGLDDLNWFCLNVIAQYKGKDETFKYHNAIMVVREMNGVFVGIKGVVTEKEERICGFINEQ